MDISEKLCKEHENKHRLVALIGLFLIFFYAVADLQLDVWYRIYLQYIDIFIISFIALSFYIRLNKRHWVEKLVWLYALWMFISRLLNGDIFLYNDFHLVVRQVAIACAFFSIGFLLDKNDRNKFLDICIWGICAYWFLLSTFGLYAVLNQTRVTLPFISATVGLGKWAGNYQLLIDYTHRNITGMWFALGTVLMMCQFLRNRNVLLRIISIVFGVVFYMATSMSFCRAAQVSLCVAISIFVMFFALKRYYNRTVKFKAVLVVGIAVLVFPVGYKSYAVVNDIFSGLSNKIVDSQQKIEVTFEEKIEDYNNILLEDNPKVDIETSSEAVLKIESKTDSSKEEVISFKESRGVENIKALGGRAYLWRAGPIVLKEDPARLYRGGISSEYMNRIVEVSTELANRDEPDPAPSMHNFIYDSLMLTGVLGCVLLVIFTTILVIKMLRIFFSTSVEVVDELKILVVPIAMILVDNMMEAHLFRIDFVHSFLFYVISGVFLAWSYEVMPRKAK